jgi:hypothetical protein
VADEMAVFSPAAHAPSLALTHAVERVIRDGVPGLLTNDTAWVETGADAPRVVCPSGHWLCDAGTRLYRGDQAFQIENPSVAVICDEEPERWKEREDVSAWWRVKIRVEVVYPADVETAALEEKGAMLSMALTQDLRTGESTVSKATDRLSRDDDPDVFLNVRTSLILEHKYSTLRERNGRSAVFFEFTAVASGVLPSS